MFMPTSFALHDRRLFRVRLTLTCMFSIGLLGACTKKDAVSDSTVAMAPDSASRAKVEDMAKPDDQMRAVIDQLAAMGGKPMETLTPTEARLQPTPAAAAGTCGPGG